MLPGEEPLLLELAEPRLDRSELSGQLSSHLLVLGSHLGEVAEILGVGGDAVPEPDLALGTGVLGGDASSVLLVIPETGGLHLPLESLDLRAQPCRVKGSPGAG